MTTPTPSRDAAAPETSVLALARPLALVLGGLVVAGAAWRWGRAGMLAAGTGVLLSWLNVWVLHRLGARATRQAAVNHGEGATQAAVGLQLALGAKTFILVALVALLANRATVAGSMAPFALGLLVTVFALLAAGLLAPLLAPSS